MCYTYSMEMIYIGIIVLLLVIFVAYYTKTNNKKTDMTKTEVDKDKLEVLMEYVQTDKEAKAEQQSLKEAVKSEKREKMEVYKRTKEELRDKLRAKFDTKQWEPLEAILNKVDKGNIGTYVLYNETKNKYYVGQAKESFKRIREHFKIEQIAIDHRDGDVIKVKILNATDASELYTEYRIDHLEKTAIEVFDASKSGYNKTTGNI